MQPHDSLVVSVIARQGTASAHSRLGAVLLAAIGVNLSTIFFESGIQTQRSLRPLRRRRVFIDCFYVDANLLAA